MNDEDRLYSARPTVHALVSPGISHTLYVYPSHALSGVSMRLIICVVSRRFFRQVKGDVKQSIHVFTMSCWIYVRNYSFPGSQLTACKPNMMKTTRGTEENKSVALTTKMKPTCSMEELRDGKHVWVSHNIDCDPGTGLSD